MCALSKCYLEALPSVALTLDVWISSDSPLRLLSVHSSDDYYEYGHSEESYDSYGEL